MMRASAATALLALALAGCTAGAPTRDSAPAESPALAHVPHETTAEGDKVVVVRDYVEPMKMDGRDEDRRVQYVWNYSRGLTQRRVWNAGGDGYEVLDMPGLTLNATQAELDYAFSVVRDDRHYADVMTPDTLLQGGFSVREANSECDARARCIHVFGVRDDGSTRVLHAIFALGTGKIVDYEYDAASGHAGNGRGKPSGES